MKRTVRQNGIVIVHRSINCSYCSTDNPVERDVIGKLCNVCGKAIYTPEFEADVAAKPEAANATADRTCEVLRVSCPHCGYRNEFPGFSMVYTFLCHDCGEPVSVDEPVQ